jgi:hypothetical protein
MTNLEKARLIEAMSKAMESNKIVGTYSTLEKVLATKILQIAESIDIHDKQN